MCFSEANLDVKTFIPSSPNSFPLGDGGDISADAWFYNAGGQGFEPYQYQGAGGPLGMDSWPAVNLTSPWPWEYGLQLDSNCFSLLLHDMPKLF